MPNEDDLRSIMIKNKMEELEELEKGIVLATIQIERMVGMGPEADLSTLAGIRKRRETIEEEYIKAKVELERLRAGELPDAENVRVRHQKAKHSLRKAQEEFDKLQDKKKDAEGELYDPDDDPELKDVRET